MLAHLTLFCGLVAGELTENIRWLPPLAVCHERLRDARDYREWAQFQEELSGWQQQDRWSREVVYARWLHAFWDCAYYARLTTCVAANRIEWAVRARHALGEERWWRQEWPIAPPWSGAVPRPP